MRLPRNFTISARQFNYQNINNALNFWSFYIKKFYNADKIESFFNSVKQSSPLYGGRPCGKNLSFSYKNVEFLNAKGIGLMLTLSNHYFTEEAYVATIPILERLENHLNSVTIVNDDLAVRIKQDFPLFKRKASVIKLINTREGIHKALELYDSVVFHPNLNDNAEFLQSVDCKDKIVLFANTRCLYKCNNPICYKYISKQLITEGKWDKSVCDNKENPEVKQNYTVFNLEDEKFNGYSSFKLIPVPNEHLQMDYQCHPVTSLKRSDGTTMIC
ncbi:MAG: hypothetical protein KAI83_19585 [Thiomargarita sp.]|nr:hypothetical protein [Thiomargarita sp.]